MGLTNKETQQRGFDAVIEHERSAGRRAKRVNAIGYDIASTGKGESRHIEVKATDKKKPSFRLMTEKEFKALLKDSNFFLYVVTNVGASPTVHEFRRDDIVLRLKGTEVNYRIGFRANDF